MTDNDLKHVKDLAGSTLLVSITLFLAGIGFYLFTKIKFFIMRNMSIFTASKVAHSGPNTGLFLFTAFPYNAFGISHPVYSGLL